MALPGEALANETMEIGAPGLGVGRGQGGPGFQEALGQEAKQEGAGRAAQRGPGRQGRLPAQRQGNPCHFLAHAGGGRGREPGKEGVGGVGVVGDMRGEAGLG